MRETKRDMTVLAGVADDPDPMTCHLWINKFKKDRGTLKFLWIGSYIIYLFKLLKNIIFSLDSCLNMYERSISFLKVGFASTVN